MSHPLNGRTLAVGSCDLSAGNVVALVAGTAGVGAARAFLKSGGSPGLFVEGDTGLLLA